MLKQQRRLQLRGTGGARIVLLLMWGGPMSIGAETQTLKPQSTVEAEMMVVSYGMKASVYLSNLWGDLGFTSFNTAPANSYRTGAMSVVANRSYPGTAYALSTSLYDSSSVSWSRAAI